ncbi:MAG: methylenetetrahydrofolate reductase [Aestuariivirgaceae bacterium]|nr:methylenetetrahydrofolate reductase [Aestuariivirgaceae bacterium]
MTAALAPFLRKASVEITPRQAEKLPLIASKVAPGTHIYIALVDPNEVEGQLAAAQAVKAQGLVAIPHVPARFVKDRDDLEARVARLAEAGVARMLVLGGGAPEPIGKYDAAIQLFETGVFQKNGILHCGIAGHPEGNPDITKIHGDAMLLKALKEKQAYLDENGITGHIATQFLFEAGPVAEWAAGLRAQGIHLPLHVGIPGPATIKTLAKYALMCGVGNSARFIRKQALNVMQLLTVNAPDEFIEELAAISAAKPDLKIAAPHMYPFGGFDKLFDWMTPKMEKAA